MTGERGSRSHPPMLREPLRSAPTLAPRQRRVASLLASMLVTTARKAASDKPVAEAFGRNPQGIRPMSTNGHRPALAGLVAWNADPVNADARRARARKAAKVRNERPRAAAEEKAWRFRVLGSPDFSS